VLLDSGTVSSFGPNLHQAHVMCVGYISLELLLGALTPGLDFLHRVWLLLL